MIFPGTALKSERFQKITMAAKKNVTALIKPKAAKLLFSKMIPQAPIP
ncbi:MULTISPECIES: hypothetical protein [unclassified Enterococcus]|nr:MULTISPECIES: hypothetical protein [unclassified Enterococcus]MDO0920307.1 hypothetical protein [Enterococcus sp. B1E2]WIV15797.1 hypothetical protein QN079_01375 [Enterococcus sp. FZMF]